jgi:4-alpha-glucanotransferase
MSFQRASGILLHPTSLPSPYGIGDLGTSAYQFIDFLAQAGQKLWQVLPLTPTGYGNSPYMSFSALAGNPMLISPDLLKEKGLLLESELADIPDFSTEKVDFEAVIPYKRQLLEKAFQRFQLHEDPEFAKFCETEAFWLDDYALFMALHEENPEIIWCDWEPEIAQRNPDALRVKRRNLASEVLFQQFMQYCFFQQWQALKQYANERHIQIVGDIPIYVSHNSADVWANPQNFQLDPETYQVAQMAGVPPDYFSATGQLWGNPVYNWEYLEETEFAWWIQRFAFLNRHVDLIRIDHFRGFESFWQVPAGETTAINGSWQPAPGSKLFQILEEKLGYLPILAEDLGIITPEVEALRDEFNFPGMRVLLFAFGGGPDNFHLPHHYVRNSLVYTGTHDNDTAVGWWQRSSAHERQLFYRYVVGYAAGEPINWVLIRLAMAAVSDLAIIPLQDVLGLDNSGRMNVPGIAAGNWGWRYTAESLESQLAEKLLDLTRLYSRG